MKPLLSIMFPLLIAAVIVVSGCTQYGQPTQNGPPDSGDLPDSGDEGETPPADAGTGSDEGTETPSDDTAMMPDNETGDESPSPMPASHTVEITDAGFVPPTLTIAAGDTVTWTNAGSGAALPASAFHPTHMAYPGSDIQKCGTAEEDNIFDACRDVEPGGSWSFTFTEVGTWHYHDHNSPSRTGTIVVE